MEILPQLFDSKSVERIWNYYSKYVHFRGK